VNAFRVATLLLGLVGWIETTASAKPNLLFILADDLGYGDLGSYGCSDIRTPRLDALAAQGMRFTDAYANGPTCSPTRYAFMTGRYQQRGGLEYALNYQEHNAGLPPGTETLANLLRKTGRRTALIGKWHLGYDTERTPNAQGFDHFFGLLGGNHHYFQHMDRLGYPDLFWNGRPVKREGYSTDLFTDDAVPDKKSLFGRHGNVPVGTGLKQRFHGVDTARMPTGRQERGRNVPGRPGHALDGPARGRLSGPNADERQTGPAAGAQPFA